MTNINYSAFQNMLNPFTQQIVNGHHKMVKLRNGLIATPAYYAEGDNRGFRQDNSYYWNLDGTSITRSDFDMIEFADFDPTQDFSSRGMPSIMWEK